MAATDEERAAYEVRRSAYWGRTALYRLFSRAGELLYIGIAMDPEARWEKHAKEKHWWAEVHSKTVEWLDDRIAARDAEAKAIKSELPKYNGMHRNAGGPPAPIRRHGDGGYVIETDSARVSVEIFSMTAAMGNIAWAKEMAMRSRPELGELPITFLTHHGVPTLAIVPAWVGGLVKANAAELIERYEAEQRRTSGT